MTPTAGEGNSGWMLPPSLEPIHSFGRPPHSSVGLTLLVLGSPVNSSESVNLTPQLPHWGREWEVEAKFPHSENA